MLLRARTSAVCSAGHCIQSTLLVHAILLLTLEIVQELLWVRIAVELAEGNLRQTEETE